jgi:hypothetical protein
MLIWLANQFIVVSWIIFKKFPALALVLSLLALSASISFLYVKEIYNLNDEWKSTIISVNNRYWFWLLSILTMVAGICVQFLTKANKATLKKIYGFALGFLTIATVFFIILGLKTPKELTLTHGGGCVETYHFHGNLDTTDINYKVHDQKLGMCLCEVYVTKKDADLGNLVLMAYSKYGYRNSKYHSTGKRYPNVDSIVKYRTAIFKINQANNNPIK